MYILLHYRLSILKFTYLCAQGQINLSRQSVHNFGGATTIFTVKTDNLFSRRCFSLDTLAQLQFSHLPCNGASKVMGPPVHVNIV